MERRQKTNLDGCSDRQEMNETNVFIPNDLDLVDRSKPLEVIPQRALIHILLQPTDVDVPRRLGLDDRHPDLGRQRRRFPPPDPEFLTMERELLDRRVGVEGGSCRAVQERNEHARFFREKPDGFDRSEPDEVQEFVHRGIYKGGRAQLKTSLIEGKMERRTGRQVSDVDGSSSLVVGGGG